MTTTTNGFQADNPPPLTELENNEDTTIAMNECKLEHSRAIGITFAVTFLVTVFFCMLLMVIVVVCLCLKLRQEKRALSNKTTLLDPANEDKEALSAVNVHACILDGLSVEKKN